MLMIEKIEFQISNCNMINTPSDNNIGKLILSPGWLFINTFI